MPSGQSFIFHRFKDWRRLLYVFYVVLSAEWIRTWHSVAAELSIIYLYWLINLAGVADGVRSGQWQWLNCDGMDTSSCREMWRWEIAFWRHDETCRQAWPNMQWQSLGRCTFWIGLLLRLSLSPKFGLRPTISQKVKSFFVWTQRSAERFAESKLRTEQSLNTKPINSPVDFAMRAQDR